MKLQQLRYIQEVARQDLSITAAARSLHTSQPGISKQIIQLEEELGVEIFTRNGKHLSGISVAGQAILEHAGRALEAVDGVKSIAQDHRDRKRGSLAIATTHTQCRYVLPPVIERFRAKFPEVSLQLHQGSPMQIAELAANGTADFAIATEALEHFSGLMMMPCYQWNRAVLVPRDHELAGQKRPSLEQLASFPLITYTFGFTGRSRLDEAFQARGLEPRVVLTAADADVIKTYVRLGLGVGIVARMAYDPALDQDLVAIDASHLFAASVTRVGFRRGRVLRGYMYDFIEMFAPHLKPELVQQACALDDAEALQAVLAELSLPVQ